MFYDALWFLPWFSILNHNCKVCSTSMQTSSTSGAPWWSMTTFPASAPPGFRPRSRPLQMASTSFSCPFWRKPSRSTMETWPVGLPKGSWLQLLPNSGKMMGDWYLWAMVLMTWGCILPRIVLKVGGRWRDLCHCHDDWGDSGSHVCSAAWVWRPDSGCELPWAWLVMLIDPPSFMSRIYWETTSICVTV